MNLEGAALYFTFLHMQEGSSLCRERFSSCSVTLKIPLNSSANRGCSLCSVDHVCLTGADVETLNGVIVTCTGPAERRLCVGSSWCPRLNFCANLGLHSVGQTGKTEGEPYRAKVIQGAAAFSKSNPLVQ